MRAIVIGGYVNGLGVVRSLAARGAEVGVVTTQPFDIAHRSRWVARSVAAQDLAARPEALLEALERLGMPGAVLFATNDEALAAIDLHREQLARTHRVVAPPPEACPALLDKRLMMDAAARAGVSAPRVYNGDVRFPVVVKPPVAFGFRERFGGKLAVAADRPALDGWLARMEDARIPALVMDLVPGPDSAIFGYSLHLDDRGTFVAGCGWRKLRQSPPGFGDARVAVIADDDGEMRDAAVAVAQEIGMTGMAVVEFKRDARDGSLQFIEVNGRSVVFNELLSRAGLDLTALALGDRPRVNGWRGAWVHLHPDLLYSLRDRIGVREFAGPYRGRFIEAVWSPRDPLPFVAQWSRTALTAARRLRGTSRAAAPRAGA